MIKLNSLGDVCFFADANGNCTSVIDQVGNVSDLSSGSCLYGVNVSGNCNRAPGDTASEEIPLSKGVTISTLSPLGGTPPTGSVTGTLGTWLSQNSTMLAGLAACVGILAYLQGGRR